MIFFLLLLGVGLSLLVTEISLKLNLLKHWWVGFYMFLGHCVAVLVGWSTGELIQLIWAVGLYWLVVCVGAAINWSSRVQ